MNVSFHLADLFNNDNWSPIFLSLFWIFAVAALVWLVIWLLFCWGDEDVEDQSDAKNETDADALAVAKSEATTDVELKLSGDDFTKLGLSAAVSKDLWAEGVTEFGHIADWKKADASGYANKFAGSNPKVDFDELPWKANALAAGVDLDSIDADDPAFGAPHLAASKIDYASVIASDFKGKDVENDPDLGIVYRKGAKPDHQDKLQDIKGVGPKLSSALNDHGVYCFKQIANWSDHNVAEFSERMNCFKNRVERDRWIPQAAVMKCKDGETDIDTASEEEARELFASELASGTVTQDAVYGIIYSKTPSDGSDDLKQIKGVAKVLEGKLNDIGVYRFKQIAVWTDAACEEFSKMLTFKDRIYRDNWIAQAKDFHEEKYSEKL